MSTAVSPSPQEDPTRQNESLADADGEKAEETETVPMEIDNVSNKSESKIEIAATPSDDTGGDNATADTDTGIDTNVIDKWLLVLGGTVKKNAFALLTGKFKV